jgi:antitoxin VapB
MAFHIRNPETDRLARKVAALRGIGLTEAVHEALKRELEREVGGGSLEDRILEFGRNLRAQGHPQRGQPADKAFYDALSGDD